MTPLQENIDAMTRGMAATFDSDFAKEVRTSMNVSNEQAREFIDTYRDQAGLPPIFRKTH